jgi:hypothetical protein
MSAPAASWMVGELISAHTAGLDGWMVREYMSAPTAGLDGWGIKVSPLAQGFGWDVVSLESLRREPGVEM